jgi:hypothetical protein
MDVQVQGDIVIALEQEASYAITYLKTFRPQMREPWVVVKGKDFEKNFALHTAGPDEFDHVIVLPDILGGLDYVIRVPQLNIDSSAISPTHRELADGVYMYVAGYHNFHLPKRYKAFFIMKFDAGVSRFPSMTQAFNSSRRHGLILTDGTTDGLYNYHRSNRLNDGSEGCWTTPTHVFDEFRASYRDLDFGLIFKLSRHPAIAARVISLLKENV